MANIADIKQAIVDLPADEYRELTAWLLERDWDNWDQEIEADSESGKLDVLEAQARAGKKHGTRKVL